MKRIPVLITAIMMAVSLSSYAFAEEKAAPAKQEKASEKVMQATGEVTAVDTKANTIAVKSKKKGDVACDVVAGTKVSASKEARTLADVKVGDKVTIKYVKKERNNTCNSIEIKTEEKK